MEAFLVAKQSGVGIVSPVVLETGGKFSGGACVLCTDEVGGSIGWPWFNFDSGKRLLGPLLAAAAFAIL